MEEFKKDLLLAELRLKCEQVNELIAKHNNAHPSKALEPITPQVIDLLGVLDGQDFSECYDNVDAILTKTARIIKIVKA